MRKQMKICGEDFDISSAEGGGLTAASVREPMFFFTGKDYADLRRRMPAEREAWQAERLKAAEQMQKDADAYASAPSGFVRRIVGGQAGAGVVPGMPSPPASQSHPARGMVVYDPATCTHKWVDDSPSDGGRPMPYFGGGSIPAPSAPAPYAPHGFDSHGNAINGFDEYGTVIIDPIAQHVDSAALTEPEFSEQALWEFVQQTRAKINAKMLKNLYGSLGR